jgi:hypothetical protein
VSHVGAVSKAQATSVASYTIDPAGTGYAAGDTLLLAVVDNNTGGNVVTVASTSGTWTQRAQQVIGSGTATLYSKVAVASESPVTVSNTVNSRGAAGIEVRRGETLDWAGITWLANSGASDVPSVAAKTISAAAATALAIAWMRSSSWVTGDQWAAVAGWTERVDAIGFGAGGSALVISDKVGPTVPATDWVTTPTAVTTNTGGAWLLVATQAAIADPMGALSGGGGFSLTARKGARNPFAAPVSTGNSTMAVTGVKGSTGGGHVVAQTDFESGVLGASILNNGTDFYNGGNTVGGGSAVYSTVGAHSGGQAMRLRTPLSTDAINRSRSFTALATYVFRGYLHLPASPGTGAWLPLTLKLGAVDVAQVRVSTAGVIQLRDAAIANGGTLALTGTDWRVEWKVQPGVGQTLRIWDAGNLDGAIANFDHQLTATCTNAGVGTVDTMATSIFGGTVVDASWDDVGFGDTDWLGPTNPSVPAASGTFGLSGGGDLQTAGTHVRQVNLFLSGGDTDSVAGSKNDADNSSFAFSTGTDTTTAKDAQAQVVLSGGGAFTTSAFATFPEVHTGTFLESDGTSSPAFTVKVNRPRPFGALSGGGGFSATVRKGAKVPTVLSGGTSSPGWSAFQSGTNSTSLSLSGGGALSVVGRKSARAVLPLSGGGAFAVASHRGAQGSVLLRTGNTEPVWTFVHADVIGQFEVGTFVLSGGGQFLTGQVPAVGWVLLEWNVSVDDHPRPHWNPLWKRVRMPHTRYGLLLYRDGRVIETPTLERPEEWDADFVISTGQWYGPADDWKAVVLRDAGYTLVSIDASSGLPGVPV